MLLYWILQAIVTQWYYYIMGPPSYIRSVVDRNVVAARECTYLNPPLDLPEGANSSSFRVFDLTTGRSERIAFVSLQYPSVNIFLTLSQALTLNPLTHNHICAHRLRSRLFTMYSLWHSSHCMLLLTQRFFWTMYGFVQRSVHLAVAV